MKMLRNFTIRFVMLTILGIFCVMWAGVGLYSTWSLSRVSDGNDVDRQLVRQMTVLSQGNDQYFRFVTRLSRAMEVKAAGGTPDLAPAQQALDNMSKKLAEMKAISPGPMDEKVSARRERILLYISTISFACLFSMMTSSNRSSSSSYILRIGCRL